MYSSFILCLFWSLFVFIFIVCTRIVFWVYSLSKIFSVCSHLVVLIVYTRVVLVHWFKECGQSAVNFLTSGQNAVEKWSKTSICEIASFSCFHFCNGFECCCICVLCQFSFVIYLCNCPFGKCVIGEFAMVQFHIMPWTVLQWQLFLMKCKNRLFDHLGLDLYRCALSCLIHFL